MYIIAPFNGHVVVQEGNRVPTRRPRQDPRTRLPLNSVELYEKSEKPAFVHGYSGLRQGEFTRVTGYSASKCGIVESAVDRSRRWRCNHGN